MPAALDYFKTFIEISIRLKAFSKTKPVQGSEKYVDEIDIAPRLNNKMFKMLHIMG